MHNISTAPRPLHPDVVRTRGLLTAVKKAGLDEADKPRLQFHDLRHTYAPLLIASESCGTSSG